MLTKDFIILPDISDVVRINLEKMIGPDNEEFCRALQETDYGAVVGFGYDGETAEIDFARMITGFFEMIGSSPSDFQIRRAELIVTPNAEVRDLIYQTAEVYNRRHQVMALSDETIKVMMEGGDGMYTEVKHPGCVKR